MKNKYYIYGKHSVLTAILNKERFIHKIYITSNYNINSLKNTLKQNNFTTHLVKKIKTVSSKELEILLPVGVNHQGIAILTEKLLQPNLNDIIAKLKSKPIATLVALDQVNDPHNIGAILRSAAAFNIDGILIPKYKNAQENSTIAKVASGALEKIPLIPVTNLSHALNILKKNDFWCIGLDSNSTTSSLTSLEQYTKVVLIFGNEGKGLRELTKTYCDIMLKIPFNHEKVESLNLSNAACISFYFRYIKN